MELDLVEALCGFQKSITTLDKRFLLITVPLGEVMKRGECKCIPGEGMPLHKNPCEKGNMIIEFFVRFPQRNFVTPEKVIQLHRVFASRQEGLIPDNADEAVLVEAERLENPPRRMGEDGNGFSRGPQQARGRDIRYPLHVSLEDLYKGKVSKLQVNKDVICRGCNGFGGKEGTSPQPCGSCQGRGIKVIFCQPAYQIFTSSGRKLITKQSVCPDCRGERTIIAEKDRCEVCNGKKTTKETKTLEVPIDPGTRENHKIVLRGEGNQKPDVEPGDVIVIIQQKEHELFVRDGDNLFMKHTINLNEALCGFHFVIQHLDGRNIVMKTSPGDIIEPGAVRGIVGEGMPRFKNPGLRGNLHVKFDVEFPQNHFADDAKLKQLAGILPHGPETQLPKDGMVEEVNLMPLDEKTAQDIGFGRREAHEDESEDEDDGEGGFPGAHHT